MPRPETDPALVARFKRRPPKADDGRPENSALPCRADPTASPSFSSPPPPIPAGWRRRRSIMACGRKRRRSRSSSRASAPIRRPHEILSADWAVPPGEQYSRQARSERYNVLQHLARPQAVILDRHCSPSGRPGRNPPDAARPRRRRRRPAPECAASTPTAGSQVESMSSGRCSAGARPNWSRSSTAAGLEAVEDPTNEATASTGPACAACSEATRMARSGAHRQLPPATWPMPRRHWSGRPSECSRHGCSPSEGRRVTIDGRELPRELQRRLLLRGFGSFAH